MCGQMTMGDGRPLMVAGHQKDRGSSIGNLFERFKCHGDEPWGDFAAVEKISAVHHAVHPTFNGRLQGAFKIGEKFRSSSAALNSRAKRKIKAQVCIGQK
jgi:hypothetical protein